MNTDLVITTLEDEIGRLERENKRLENEHMTGNPYIAPTIILNKNIISELKEAVEEIKNA